VSHAAAAGSSREPVQSLSSQRVVKASSIPTG
jgi:hypothetical protein